MRDKGPSRVRQQKGALALLLLDAGVGSGTRGEGQGAFSCPYLSMVPRGRVSGVGRKMARGGGGERGRGCVGTEGALDSEGERGWPGRWI